MEKITVKIRPNDINILNDGDLIAHLDAENLIELYDNSGAMDEVVYYDNDPQLETSEPVRRDVKLAIVQDAITHFWEEEIVNYIEKYTKEHLQDIEDLQVKLNKQDRDQAYTEYMLSRYEDY